MEKSFNTAEKFILLCHHPERGRFMVSRQYIQYGLPGAILMDLCLDGKLGLHENRIVLKSESIPSDPVMAEVVKMITESARSRKTAFWVRKMGFSYNRYLKLVLNALAKRRIVRFEDRKFLWVIPWRRSYLVESYTRSNVVRQLKNDILVYRGDTGDTTALAGLIEACRMHRILSADKDELRIIRSQLKIIIKDNPVTDVVKQTIREVQAAIITSVTAAVIASTAGRR
ncbi:MAG: GOLPH3/VPS74 family protein [Actinomycetota bacterium]|jgi:hypothetical protein